jgi:hypothetical protein
MIKRISKKENIKRTPRKAGAPIPTVNVSITSVGEEPAIVDCNSVIALCIKLGDTKEDGGTDVQLSIVGGGYMNRIIEEVLLEGLEEVADKYCKDAKTKRDAIKNLQKIKTLSGLLGGIMGVDLGADDSGEENGGGNDGSEQK